MCMLEEGVKKELILLSKNELGWRGEDADKQVGEGDQNRLTVAM